jgi:DNA-binding FadR family transcriptional regulator
MRRAIERMRASERGEDDPLASDIAFHVAVLRASGNRFFTELEDLIETALRISIRLTNQVKGVSADVNAHKKVMDAIAARNPERARAAMETIIQEVMELIGSRRRSKSKDSQRKSA